MQVQEHVGEHAQRAVSRRVVVLVAEDRRVDLCLCRIFQPIDLFLRLGGDVGLEGLNILFDPGGYLFKYPGLVAVFSVRIVFVSHKSPELN
jgi:hypothetical protein